MSRKMRKMQSDSELKNATQRHIERSKKLLRMSEVNEVLISEGIFINRHKKL